MNGDLVVLAEDRIARDGLAASAGVADRARPAGSSSARTSAPPCRASGRSVTRQRSTASGWGCWWPPGPRRRSAPHEFWPPRRPLGPLPDGRRSVHLLWQDGSASRAAAPRGPRPTRPGKGPHEQRGQPRTGTTTSPGSRQASAHAKHRLLHRPHAAQAGGQRGGDPQGVRRGGRVPVQVGLRQPGLGQDRQDRAQGLRRADLLRGGIPAGRHAQRRQGLRGPRRRPGRCRRDGHGHQHRRRPGQRQGRAGGRHQGGRRGRPRRRRQS